MQSHTQQQTIKRSTKKRRGIIAGIIFAILIIATITVTVIAKKNVKAMNQCIDSVLSELEKYYTITPMDAGEYSEMKLYGLMKFRVEQYQIEELGNLSIMRVNMGVMQMATAVITPKDKNLPLLSADYIYVLSNRKAYLEFYDVVKEKNDQYTQLLTALSESQKQYNSLKDMVVSPAWYEHLLSVASYKSGTSGDDTALHSMLLDSVKIYLDHSLQFPPLTAEERSEKLAITVEYTNGLIDKGGISTDVFKKQLGTEKTRHFFDRVFFGTGVN